MDDRENWQATMRHIALEGRCFVLSACQYLSRSDLPPDVARVWHALCERESTP
ncbi:hypothetical protein ACFQ1S_37260 [Kibdelosporangium lantanae]|uniref:Uncharacterized protein n=1 Tax=Kibdelosporangium lantanae TaxID=1497396 RepID=A0ABW3MJA3_9PSEU